jgi:hypothetical protein
MSENPVPRMTLPIQQAQALVEYVEHPDNTTGVGLLTWAQYYHAKIALLQSHLPTAEKIRYTHLHQHPRALTAVELELYLEREVAYLQERLAYVEKKLQQLWEVSGLAAHQARTVREGLELSFTYRELTEMWERGV